MRCSTNLPDPKIKDLSKVTKRACHGGSFMATLIGGNIWVYRNTITSPTVSAQPSSSIVISLRQVLSTKYKSAVDQLPGFSGS